jgi:two-component system, cell cycle sensor histidine kinase and response regulator CckA
MKKISFIKLFQVWGVIFLTGLGVSFVSIDLLASYFDLKFRVQQIREDYINQQKSEIQREVKRAVEIICHERAQAEKITKNKIQERVSEAFAIAQNIHQRNINTQSAYQIPQMIVDALRPIRFENGTGYYFVTRMDGMEILFADRPQLEGMNLIDMKDTRGRFVIRDMIEIGKNYGEGFYEYYWTKPETEGSDFKKISFIKRFEPYDWLIGTGLYVDDIERQIQANLLSIISKIRFGKEGYLFINKLNGDVLVSNGEIVSGNKKLWEFFSDNPEAMKDIFKKEYEAASKPEGDYIRYSHIKLSTSAVKSQKLSYIYGIPELNWLVGAGFYLDDVETHISSMQAEVYKQIKIKIFYFILAAVVIVVLFFLFFSWLNHRLKSDMNLLVSFFDRAAHSDETIDQTHIKFDELDRMAQYANKMLMDRRHAEQTLKQSQSMLARAEEISKVGSWEWDATTNTVTWSEELFRIMGKDPKEKAPSFAEQTELYAPEDLPRVQMAAKAAVEKGMPFELELRLVMKDGTVRHCLARGQAQIGPSGKATRLYGSLQDITANKRAEEEREKLQTQLSQAHKMESVGRLAGGVAHDFNNMLGVILGHTEMAIEQVPQTHPMHADLEEVRKAAKRSADLTRQLLAFARKQTVTPVLLNLNDAVSGMLKMLQRIIGEDIDLRWVPGNGLYPVKMDPSQLDQILVNLCINARDAIGDAGGRVTIETQPSTIDENYCEAHAGVIPGDYTLLAVSDNGEGMGQETLSHLFEPFFTTKKIGEGTGLGLATVYGIVQQNRGVINVYSEAGRGTTFKIYLPRQAPAADPAVDGSPGPAQARGSETILLVEDEPAILRMTMMMLERMGYTVLGANTPGEAIRLAEDYSGHIQLLMTDVVMPEMNGRELAKRLLQIHPELKCLFMSGYTANVIAHHGILDNGLHYIQKPFSKKELSLRVLEALS